MTRIILSAMIGLAVLVATLPVTQANAETEFSSFNEVRVYFEPWDVLHVVAMTPERLIATAPISVKILGVSRSRRVAEGVLLPERADVTVEETQDVRLVVEFYHRGVLKRTAYATDQVLYDGSGRAIRSIDSSFRERFSALGLWEAEEKPGR